MEDPLRPPPPFPHLVPIPSVPMIRPHQAHRKYQPAYSLGLYGNPHPPIPCP